MADCDSNQPLGILAAASGSSRGAVSSQSE